MSPTARPSLHGVLSPQLLAAILSDHERYVRREPGGKRAVFKFVQLAGMDLSARLLDDADFTAASMSRARLLRTSVQRASFFGADLSLADMRGANARRADFRGAVLRGANLAYANLDDADMRRAVLAIVDPEIAFRRLKPGSGDLPTRTCLAGAALNGVQLDQAEAGGADFSNCSLKNARLNGANLKGALFVNALLSGAHLKGANLTGVDLTGAVLVGVRMDELNLPADAFRDCVCDPGPEALSRLPVLAARLAEAQAWVEHNGASGAAANLEGEDIRVLGTALRGRTLPALNGRNCLGIGVDFSNIQLPGAVFDGADLRDANFTGADLRGVSFRGCNLAFARFDGSIIGALELVHGARLDSNFEGADLTGVRLDLASIQAARDMVA